MALDNPGAIDPDLTPYVVYDASLLLKLFRKRADEEKSAKTNHRVYPEPEYSRHPLRFSDSISPWQVLASVAYVHEGSMGGEGRWSSFLLDSREVFLRLAEIYVHPRPVSSEG
jgi:hypothetical protein